MKGKQINFNKQTLYFFAGLVVVIVAIFFVGKLTAKNTPAKISLPKDEVGGALTEEEKVQAHQMANDLFNELDGISWNYNEKIFADYLYFSNKLFVATYNDYNKNFSKDGKTLKTDMSEETFVDWWEIKPAVKTYGELIVKKMDKLNLP